MGKVSCTDQKPTKSTIIEFVKESAVDEVYLVQDFDGKIGSLTVLYISGQTHILVGIGDTPTRDEMRECAKAGMLKAISLKRENVTVCLVENHEYVITEATLLAQYNFDEHKTEKAHDIEDVEFFGDITNEAVERAMNIANAVTYARNLQNDNASVVTPEYIAQEAIDMTEECDKIQLEILNEDDLQSRGLNLLWAVGQGSPTPPRLVIMNYVGNPDSKYKTAVVGKGVTFDSGGLSLKPSASMVNMRMDMSGASAVMGLMDYLIETKSTENIIAVIPTAHNAIGSDVYYLGDSIRSYNGKTVEIRNTDAEGRLILADALSYVAKNYKPDEIIDLATLTGAVLVALGDTVAGVFGSKEIVDDLYIAGEYVGEPVWELPIRKEHREAMKSDIADLSNISNIGRNCGSITAAAFLENFVEDIPWCHIDIAGTSHNEKEGGTGFGVRLLIKYLD